MMDTCGIDRRERREQLLGIGRIWGAHSIEAQRILPKFLAQ